MVDKIAEIAWTNGDDIPVLEALAGGKARLSRRPLQNFMSFHEHIFLPQWAKMTGAGTTGTHEAKMTPDAVLQLLLNRAIELTGRCLDERSLKWINSIWLYLTDPSADLLTANVKQQWYRTTKEKFNRMAKGVDQPTQYLLTLPPSPNALFEERPELFGECYGCRGGQREPSSCPLDMTRLQRLDASYRCRGLGREAPLPGELGNASGVAVAAAPVQEATPSLQSMMGAFMAMQMQMMGCQAPGAQPFGRTAAEMPLGIEILNTPGRQQPALASSQLASQNLRQSEQARLRGIADLAGFRPLVENSSELADSQHGRQAREPSALPWPAAAPLALDEAEAVSPAPSQTAVVATTPAPKKPGLREHVEDILAMMSHKKKPRSKAPPNVEPEKEEELEEEGAELVESSDGEGREAIAGPLPLPLRRSKGNGKKRKAKRSPAVKHKAATQAKANAATADKGKAEAKAATAGKGKADAKAATPDKGKEDTEKLDAALEKWGAKINIASFIVWKEVAKDGLDRNTWTCRAYDRTKRACKRQGVGMGDSPLLCRHAYNQACRMWDARMPA